MHVVGNVPGGGSEVWGDWGNEAGSAPVSFGSSMRTFPLLSGLVLTLLVVVEVDVIVPIIMTQCALMKTTIQFALFRQSQDFGHGRFPHVNVSLMIVICINGTKNIQRFSPH